MFRPDTDLYLLKCPLEMDNNNQLTFANATAQFNYFNSLPKVEIEASTYQRKDSTVRYAGNIENLYGYNYCMYRNHNYSNKWFYAYVTDLQWANEQTTIVSLKTDVYQTWQFDLTFKPSFVEREHVNNDTFGLHTIEENFPTGEFVSNGNGSIKLTNPKSCFVTAMVSELPSAMQSTYTNRSRIYNGVPNGCYIIMVDISEDYQNLNRFINYYDSVGKSDAIVAMYLTPKSLLGTSYVLLSFDLDEYSFDGYVPSSSTDAITVSNTLVTKNTTLNGYTPKNNKMYTHQFNYLMVVNNNGGNAIFNWEDFASTPNFRLIGTFQQGTPTKLIPTNYKNTSNIDGDIYGLTGAEYPIVSWNSDYYLNYQAKNGFAGAKQRADDYYGNIVSTRYGEDVSVGEMAKNVAFGLAQTAKAIGSIISGSMADAERVPAQVTGDPSNNDFTYAINKCEFTYYKMSVRAEVAKIIDDYFTAYGYKVASFKLPNRTGRLNWNYVKTVGCNIEGDIPQADMQEIKGIFDSGVTLWHNPSTFLDYSQSNSIV